MAYGKEMRAILQRLLTAQTGRCRSFRVITAPQPAGVGTSEPNADGVHTQVENLCYGTSERLPVPG